MATLNLSDLTRTLSRMQNLRGLDNNALRAAGFDGLLDELEAEADTITELREINAQLMNIDAALAMLLTMLDECQETPVPSAGLRCLMEPLRKQFYDATMAMNAQLF